MTTRDHTNQMFRYLVNGVFATIVHYLVLSMSIESFHFKSAALANLIASMISIFISFIGNRIYVFNKKSDPMLAQFIKFFGMYCLIALVHGLVLFIWADSLKLDYRVGFLLAVFIQIILGYIGNKKVIFYSGM